MYVTIPDTAAAPETVTPSTQKSTLSKSESKSGRAFPKNGKSEVPFLYAELASFLGVVWCGLLGEGSECLADAETVVLCARAAALWEGRNFFAERKKERRLKGENVRSAGFTLCAFCGMGNVWMDGMIVGRSDLLWFLFGRWRYGGVVAGASFEGGGALGGSRAHVIALVCSESGREKGAWERVERVRGGIVRNRAVMTCAVRDDSGMGKW